MSPFKSLQQAKWTYSQKPQMAKEFSAKTNWSKLPKKVKKKKHAKKTKKS